MIKRALHRRRNENDDETQYTDGEARSRVSTIASGPHSADNFVTPERCVDREKTGAQICVQRRLRLVMSYMHQILGEG
ncbi:hypothetical protein Y032_0042g605 [Ancylostoma ceylanicum]|uniref:Uncharacterized protein n=1 Tax=Ancylostoma ceylanicum TaxID=53326 RepID=A0A016UG88_9BILA|nr:hypothetical protein Y032_0042g605 [Ancylostoma ceylanicum]